MPLQLHQGKGAGLSGSTEGSAVASLWPAPAPPRSPDRAVPERGAQVRAWPGLSPGPALFPGVG